MRHAPAHARRQQHRIVIPCDHHPHRIATVARHRSEPYSELSRQLPFRLRYQRNAIDAARIDHDHSRQNRAIVREPDVSAIAAGEKLPIDATGIIALSVRAILRELRRNTPQA